MAKDPSPDPDAAAAHPAHDGLAVVLNWMTLLAAFGGILWAIGYALGQV
jgi:hypothetical protein